MIPTESWFYDFIGYGAKCVDKKELGGKGVKLKASLYISAVKVGILKILLFVASRDCVKHVNTLMTPKPKQ